MSDPQRWQLGHQTYPSLPYANQPQQSQQSAYHQPELTMYDPSLQPQPQPQHQHQHQQQPSPLPPLRPLQPSPYPAAAGYPVYPYPRNNAKPISPEELESDKAENRRTRISRACDACRRKKIKCDTSGPGNTCKNCKYSKVECTFNDSAKKRGPPKGYIEVLENRLKRMERILGNLADEEEEGEGEKPKDNNNSIPKKKQKEPIMSQTKVVKVTPTAIATPAEESTGASTENSSEISKPLYLSSGVRTRYIGDMSPLPFLAQKINFEDARIASKIGVKIKRFGQSLVLYEKDEKLNGNGINQTILEELNLIKPGETIKGINDWIYKVSGVDKVTSDRLMKVYFAYIHPGLPVVNKVLFLKQYRGEIAEYPSAPLLNSIYGAAVRYIETCDSNGDKLSIEHHLEMKDGWSEKLFDNLIMFVKGRYAPCITTVQALVIGQNHRASLDEKMASGWLLNSAAVRMAQDLGLHRSSEAWDIPDSEKETRKRVWWAVYIMDKWSAASTGRPQTVFDEDCDESYPNESADWDEVMDVDSKSPDNQEPRFPSLDKNVAQKAKNENIPIYQPFVQLVKLSEILGRILQGLYTPLAKKHSEKHGSDAVVTYLDNALSEWRAALPPALQISSINVRRLDSHGRTPLLSMSGLMYLSYCTLLILLHRPFIEKEGGQKTRSSQSSLSICTSAATRCVDIAEKMHYRDFLLVSWNFAIYPVFTAALVHIYNAANPDSIVSDVAKSNLIKATGVIRRLAKLSTGAQRLYEVLRQLMALRDISVDKGEWSDDDEEQQPARKKNRCDIVKMRPKKINTSPTLTKTPYKQKNNSNSSQDEITINDLNHKIGKVSDVGRGSTQNNNRLYLNRDSSAELHSPSNNVLSDSEVGSTHSTPSSLGNGDWINGLYSSLQSESINQMPNENTMGAQQPHMFPQQQQQQQQPHQQKQQAYQSPLEAESYSLRQFGINMDQILPPNMNQQQPTSNQNMPLQQQQASNTSMSTQSSQHHQQPLQQQQQHASSIMLPINPSDSFLFGLSDYSFSTPYNAPNVMPTTTTYDNSTLSTTTSSSSNSYPLQQQQQQPQAMMDQTVFRNRPDNPFWSVPSSIELDDWTAYLLPQQPTSTVSTTAASTSVPIQQQQPQQHGWNSSGWV